MVKNIEGMVVIEKITKEEADLFETVKSKMNRKDNLREEDYVALRILVSNPEVFHIGKWTFEEKR